MTGEQMHAMPLGRLDHGAGLVQRYGHRLLDHDMLAVARRQDGVFGMKAIRAGDPDRINIGVAAQVLGG